MTANSIPNPSQPIAGGLSADPVWFKFFRELERRATAAGVDLSADIRAIAIKLGSPDGSIAGIPPQSLTVSGLPPIYVSGNTVGLQPVTSDYGGTPQAFTVDAYGRVTLRRPIEPDELPEPFRVWLTDQTGAYLTDELGQYLCAAGIELPSPILNFVGMNQPSPQRRLHMVGTDGSGGALPAAVGARNELVYENNGNSNIALVGPSSGASAVLFYTYGASTFTGLQAFRSTSTLRLTSGGVGTVLDLEAGSLTFNTSNTVWHSGNSAQIQAGTIEGQLARWNNTAGRYEPVAAAGLVNAANDAAAQAAGVPVSGIYRNGSVLQIRVA